MFFMKNETTYIFCRHEGNTVRLKLRGDWRVTRLDRIETQAEQHLLQCAGEIVIDCGGIETIDTGAMVFFISLRERLKKRGKVRTVGISREFCQMYRLVRRYVTPLRDAKAPRFAAMRRLLDAVGLTTERLIADLLYFLNFLGALTVAFGRIVLHPGTFRIKETASNLYKAGVTAIPIVALSAFLVGVVIAYQSAVQLQKYGANIFIVDMIGISIPRELAPLITAIIVAGRSGSAYTAQIGVMKITEELDAMKTMGFEIFRFVVLPRVVAMVIALPLLIFFADIVGIYAGMLVAKGELQIGFTQFLDRLQHAVDVRHYLIGLFKAPFFAFIIAAIGCFRGFEVSGDTESIGRYTTMSVVNAIFLVVALDALFSVIFTELGI